MLSERSLTTGGMAGAAPLEREACLEALMNLPNTTWAQIMQQAGARLETFNNPEVGAMWVCDGGGDLVEVADRVA